MASCRSAASSPSTSVSHRRSCSTGGTSHAGDGASRQSSLHVGRCSWSTWRDTRSPLFPCSRLPPLNPNFREIIAGERDLPIKTVRLERDRDLEAVIIRPPLRLLKAWRNLPIPDRRENSFTQTHHLPDFDDRWIGMTRDRTWVDNGPLGPSQLEDVGALSLYVNQLVGLDENGAPPRRPRQGPIPDYDAEALEVLVP